MGCGAKQKTEKTTTLLLLDWTMFRFICNCFDGKIESRINIKLSLTVGNYCTFNNADTCTVGYGSSATKQTKHNCQFL